MKFKNIINENKQIGIIYHFTTVYNTINILQENIINAIITNGISFTRNPDFYKYPRDGIITSVKITVDGNKLSNKYKIKPYNFFPDKYTHYLKFDEDEELVLTKEITNFRSYIKNVTLVKETNAESLVELKQTCKNYNIPFYNFKNKGY